MVDSPIPPPYWPESVIARSDLSQFKFAMKDDKEKYDADWEALESFFQIYPDVFVPGTITKEIYMWALGFMHTRTFGWGLPCTMMVPLADCVNHSNDAPISFNLLEKNLHKSMNKIYMYKHNFDKIDEENNDEDKIYDKSNPKIKIACNKLFAEDELDTVPEEVRKSWTGPHEESADQATLYSRKLCFERFRYNQSQHAPDAATAEEQKFDLDSEEFGKQLWGIGYISSDQEEQRDDDEELEDEDELFKEFEIIQKIHSGQPLSPAQMENVWYSTRLRDIYNNRWWQYNM